MRQRCVLLGNGIRCQDSHQIYDITRERFVELDIGIWYQQGFTGGICDNVNGIKCQDSHTGCREMSVGWNKVPDLKYMVDSVIMQ